MTRVRVGDRVIVSPGMQPGGGTWAEFSVVTDSAVTVIPDALDFDSAAGIPVAGKSMIDAMHTFELSAGDTLFVAGASGAIGTLAVQWAVQRGIRVIGSASTANHDYLKELGAEAAVDYRAPDWVDAVKRWAPEGTDAALAIQPGTGASSQQLVRAGGHVVTVSGDAATVREDVRVEQFNHRPLGEDMDTLVADIAARRIRLVLERVYGFEQALEALEKTESRRARGKVVVCGPGRSPPSQR